MTIDIGYLFRSAQATKGTWDHEDVQQVAGSLAGPELQIDWEPGDEEWARLVDLQGNMRVILCVRLPIGIAHEGIATARLSSRVSWLVVTSMTEKLFTVDRQLLEQIFHRQLSTNVDYSRLSINDLWWATVS